jgi:integrase
MCKKACCDHLPHNGCDHLPRLHHRPVVSYHKGKGSKERRIALGNNCLRNLLYYLDRHRSEEEELTEWGSAGEDHLFLSETRLPLTKNGVNMLFKRIRERAEIKDKCVSPHIFRHSFAVRYLILGNDPFSMLRQRTAGAATQHALEGTFHQRCKGHIPRVLLEHLQEQGYSVGVQDTTTPSITSKR